MKAVIFRSRSFASGRINWSLNARLLYDALHYSSKWMGLSLASNTVFCIAYKGPLFIPDTAKHVLIHFDDVCN